MDLFYVCPGNAMGYSGGNIVILSSARSTLKSSSFSESIAASEAVAADDTWDEAGEADTALTVGADDEEAPPPVFCFLGVAFGVAVPLATFPEGTAVIFSSLCSLVAHRILKTASRSASESILALFFSRRLFFSAFLKSLEFAFFLRCNRGLLFLECLNLCKKTVLGFCLLPHCWPSGDGLGRCPSAGPRRNNRGGAGLASNHGGGICDGGGSGGGADGHDAEADADTDEWMVGATSGSRVLSKCCREALRNRKRNGTSGAR